MQSRLARTITSSIFIIVLTKPRASPFHNTLHFHYYFHNSRCDVLPAALTFFLFSFTRLDFYLETLSSFLPAADIWHTIWLISNCYALAPSCFWRERIYQLLLHSFYSHLPVSTSILKLLAPSCLQQIFDITIWLISNCYALAPSCFWRERIYSIANL
jgi:hypothetical protein